MGISDLWKSEPQPCFPSFFFKLLDLDELVAESNQKADKLRQKIDKRKLDEKRREEAKL